MAGNKYNSPSEARAAIVKFGKALADQGAHYLWAGGGDNWSLQNAQLTPGPKYPTFCAAIGANTCVGRFRAVGGYIDGDSGCPDLSSFSPDPNSQAGWGGSSDQQSSPGVAKLTPRLIFSDGGAGAPTDYTHGKVDLTGKIIWGEGCDATQHFDCGGFIRYVVKQTCGVPVENVSKITETNDLQNIYQRSMGRVLQPNETLRLADILCYNGHIAFCIDAGKPYVKGTAYLVLQAESAVYGLNYNKTHNGDTHCVRLSASTLLNQNIDDYDDEAG